MAKRDVDPYDPSEVWRRLRAVVTWTGRSERSFALWCEINYNQWNNYKQAAMLPSAQMFERIARRTGVNYMFLRYGEIDRLTRQQDEEILPILKRDQ